MIISLNNVYGSKKKIVKVYVEDLKDEYLERIYSLNNDFYLSFFEQSVECTVADAYDFFVELNCENNIFYENLKEMNLNRGRKLFKIMGIYHTIRMLRKKRSFFNVIEFQEVLAKVFDLNEKEERLFELLYRCDGEFESQFAGLFAKAFAKYVFNCDNCGPFSLAFIENFCYNSYSSFMASFTKFISLKRRLKKAAINM